MVIAEKKRLRTSLLRHAITKQACTRRRSQVYENWPYLLWKIADLVIAAGLYESSSGLKDLEQTQGVCERKYFSKIDLGHAYLKQNIGSVEVEF